MKLSILERLQLRPILPAKGSFIELMLSHGVMTATAVTPEEQQTVDFTLTDTGVRWDKSKEGEEIDFSFSDAETSLIVKSLKELDERGELEANQASLYKKFVQQE